VTEPLKANSSNIPSLSQSTSYGHHTIGKVIEVVFETQTLSVCQVVMKGKETTEQASHPSVIVHPSDAIIFALAHEPRQY
jgi:NADH:ubiquinone oxidoreductase subunit H